MHLMGCLSLAFVFQEWYVKLFGSDSEAAGLFQFGVEFQNGGNRFLTKPSLSFHFLRFFAGEKTEANDASEETPKGDEHPAREKRIADQLPVVIPSNKRREFPFDRFQPWSYMVKKIAS